MIPTTELSHVRPSAVPPRTRLELITVCSLHWKHGLEFAIQAIDLLRHRGVHLHYAIVGDGPLFEAVGFSRHDLKLHREVSIVRNPGPEDVRTLVAQADLYLSSNVAPASEEGRLAASQRGVPIICTDIERSPGSELVEGVFAVVPRRDPGAMAQAVTRWLESQGDQSSWT